MGVYRVNADAEASRELGYDVELRREGKAVFYAPRIASMKNFAPTDLPVFFNPVSKPNRDLSILLLAARFGGERIRVCDPLAGTGVRSIRIALETDVAEEVVANDISPRACELIRRNVELNRVESLVRVSNLDANQLLASREPGEPRYGYVDVDPAGSPAPFIENAFRACRRGGVVGATATDMPALVGAKPESCIRKYDAKPLRTPFSKELALRILAGFMVRSAARLGLAAKPIYSFSKDHYIKVFVEVDRGRRLANEQLKKLGWISYCPRCLKLYVARRFEPPIQVCEGCGSAMGCAGPLWLEALTDGELALKVRSRAYESPELYRESLKLVEGLAEEDHELLGYFPVNVLAKAFGKPPIKPAILVEELRRLGYRASRTHADPSGVKTDAPLEAIREAFEEAKT